jgi:hypothetical protein
MAAENVLSLIKAEEDASSASQTPVELKEYKPPAYGIKVSLGRVSVSTPNRFCLYLKDACVSQVLYANMRIS